MSVRSASRPCLLTLVFAWFLCSPFASAADAVDGSVFAYESARDSAADVAQARAQALVDGKLMMVVFGAEWCHDSVGFANKLSEPHLLSVVQQRFEVVFVDLGFYSRALTLFQSFGMPTYFGTPTVLVVDPKTNQVLNEDSLAKWQSADSVPAAEYLAYFSQSFAAPMPADPVEAAALAAVRGWESQQAARLQAGFDQLGPMLAMEAEGQAPPALDRLWVEVRNFRVLLQRDLVDLRSRARAGETFADDAWPVYPGFSWEQ